MILKTRDATSTATRRACAAILSLAVSCGFGMLGPLVSRGSAQSPSESESRASARRLGALGIEAYRALDFTRAEEQLDAAFKLYPTPTLGLWSGRARVQLGRWIEAAARFREATRIPETVGETEAQRQAQRDAEFELDALLPRIPTLTIRLENAAPSEVRATVDGQSLAAVDVGVPHPMNPGRHRVVVDKDAEHREAEIDLGERSNEVRVFEFQAKLQTEGAVTQRAAETQSPPFAEPNQGLPQTPAGGPQPSDSRPPPTDSIGRTLRPIAIAAVALGGVGLATSGISALIANGKLDDCPDKRCSSRAAKESYDSAKAISTASFYVGAALLAGGIATWILAPSDAETPSGGLSWELSPQGAVLRAKF